MKIDTKLKQCKITWEDGTYRACHFTRTVHNAFRTGHTAKTWGGTELFQWKGWVHLWNGIKEVYGYSHTFGTPPVDWSNDTY